MASSAATSNPISTCLRKVGLLVNSSSTARVTRSAPGATVVADVVSMSTLGSSGPVARASSVPSRDTVSTASSGPASWVRSGTVGSSGSGVAPWYSGRPVPRPVIVYVHAPASGSSTSTRPIARTCRRSPPTVTTRPSSTASGQVGSTVARTTAPAGTVGPAACTCRATAQVTVASSASGRYAVRLSSVGSGRAGSFGQLTVGSFTDTGANGSTSAHSTARSPVSAASSTGGRRAGGGSAAGASGDAEGSDDSGRSVSGAEVTRCIIPKSTDNSAARRRPRVLRVSLRPPAGATALATAYWIVGGGRRGGPGEVGVLASSTRSRTRSLGLVGLAIVGSGLLVNAYLAIIARNISAAEYAYFGAFWSLALVAGFGVFLPIEQETARLLQVPDRPRGLLRAALLTALSLAAVQVVLVAAAAPWLARAFGGHGVSVVAFGVLCLISAGQFVVRGALVGMDRMDRYALVMVLDSLFRVVFAAAVAVAVDDPGSATFAWTLVAAVGLAHAPQLYLLATRRVRLGTVPAMGTHTVTAARCAAPSPRCCSARCARSCCSTARRC